MKNIINFFDGAFGTYYISKTNDYEPCERANINNKEAVLAIHKEYISAGADAIKTNTFSANGKVFENERELKEIITQGYLLANQAAAGTNAVVFADIGNISGEEKLQEKYLQAAELFIELGASRFLFETLASFDEIVPALEAIKAKVKNAVTIASFASSRDGFTANGIHYRNLISKAVSNKNIDIVGLNCVCGPTHMLSLVNELVPITKPLVVMPNSGYPDSINGRIIYNDNTDYFAQKLLEIKQAGASILGGCCGTTPLHIANAVKLINSNTTGTSRPVSEPAKEIYSFIKSNGKLKRKPISVELDPPSDCDMGFIMKAADKLKSCGVSTITLADSPLAKTRADSFLTAAMLKREINIDVLPHLTCRDKNYIAIKGSLLGASFYGIDKVLVVTGDPVITSDNYRNPGVFNFNSKELIKYIKSLNAEVFMDKDFSIGGAININALNFDSELNRCREKIDNGAGFLYSQPLFSDKSIDNFIKAGQELNCKLLAGILPLVSYKNAVFLNNEVGGINIPQNIVDSLKDKSSDQTRNLSIEFCHNIIKRIYNYADGFYLMTPMRKVDLVCELIQRCFDD